MDVDLIGWVGVGLEGTCGCRCGILCTHMLVVVFYASLVSLPSSYPSPCSPYSSELIGCGFFLVCLQGFAIYKSTDIPPI